MNENARLRRHKLLTKALAADLPPLYSTEETPLADKKVAVKFFSPYSGWTWYVLEGEALYEEPRRKGRDGEPLGEPVDYRFFAWVEGDFPELGYVVLSELEGEMIGGGVPAVERDLRFGTPRLGDVAELPGWSS